MKELNELVELANLANIAGQGTPQMADFRVTANPDNILAIAKAFRALEQRAEAAEAKLAELEKQEPVFQIEVSGNHWLNAGPVDDTDFTALPDGINNLYARPAPAVSLAEMVPGGYNRSAKDYDDDSIADIMFANGFDACRAAILRNIK